MVCKGICVRHRAQKPPGAFGRYATGQKRCQVCEIFLKWDGMWCPCCGYRVRTRPRGHKFKERLRIMNQKMKSNSSVNTPVQKPKENFILVSTSSWLKIIKHVLTEPYSSLSPTSDHIIRSQGFWGDCYMWLVLRCCFSTFANVLRRNDE
jgi:hypothetical protein